MVIDLLNKVKSHMHFWKLIHNLKEIVILKIKKPDNRASVNILIYIYYISLRAYYTSSLVKIRILC